jgi:uncharacterized iron-regulated protein
LGEIHDNPDQHRLQAQLIGALVKMGRRPSIVLEMVPADFQTELNRHRGDGVSGAMGLGKLLRWEERGWPAWPIYQPIAEAALSSGLPLIAGGLDSRAEKALRSGQPLPSGTPLETGALQPLQPPLSQALSREVQEAHCNLLPSSAVEPMVRIQRLRDAYLARAMSSASERDGAVLIAGAGHVRKDWAVPRILTISLNVSPASLRRSSRFARAGSCPSAIFPNTDRANLTGLVCGNFTMVTKCAALRLASPSTKAILHDVYLLTARCGLTAETL